MKRSTLRIGTISADTCKDSDIANALVWELRRLHLSRADRAKYHELTRALAELPEDDDLSDEEQDTLSEVTEELRMLAENYVPPFCYLGNHEGDGACLGVWTMSAHDIESDDVLRVSDTSEVPRGHTGYVLHVNERGNTTLYQASRGRLRELWAVV